MPSRDMRPAGTLKALLVALLLWPLPLAAEILRVEGRLPAGPVDLSIEQLQTIGTTTMVTITPWTERPMRFEGILLRRLLHHLDATGEEVRAQALNDYAATIPVAELNTVDVLLAWSADGRRLHRRDKGPFWIVYPWSDRPDLNDRLHRQRSVWQVVRLIVR